MNATIDSDNLPWKCRPAMTARFGRAAEAALTKEAGTAVAIQAFELGNARGNRRALKLLALLVLAPIWIPLFMIAALVLAIPSMVYIPYRIWREWDEAKALGVSSAALILNIVLVIGFGYIGGIILTLILLGKVLDLGNTVVVARSGDRVSVLYQQMPMLTFPRFRRIEHFAATDLSLQGPASAKRVVLSLRNGDTPTLIYVRRGLQAVSGSPEVNEANVRLLVGR
jgi:hypothetical protein